MTRQSCPKQSQEVGPLYPQLSVIRLRLIFIQRQFLGGVLPAAGGIGASVLKEEGLQGKCPYDQVSATIMVWGFLMCQ